MGEKELEERQNQLDSKMLELNNEQDKIKSKREELEKWEKYLYNTELKQMNKVSFSGHRRLTNSAEFNGKRSEVEGIHRLYQEVDVDGGVCDAKDTKVKSEWSWLL